MTRQSAAVCLLLVGLLVSLSAAQTGKDPAGTPRALVAMKAGRVYRMKLSADGTSIVGDAEELFKTTNRYRDIAFAPDGRTIFLITDPTGRTTDSAGVMTTALENGGSILEFSYKDQR